MISPQEQTELLYYYQKQYEVSGYDPIFKKMESDKTEIRNAFEKLKSKVIPHEADIIPFHYTEEENKSLCDKLSQRAKKIGNMIKWPFIILPLLFVAIYVYLTPQVWNSQLDFFDNLIFHAICLITTASLFVSFFPIGHTTYHYATKSRDTLEKILPYLPKKPVPQNTQTSPEKENQGPSLDSPISIGIIVVPFAIIGDIIFIIGVADGIKEFWNYVIPLSFCIVANIILFVIEVIVHKKAFSIETDHILLEAVKKDRALIEKNKKAENAAKEATNKEISELNKQMNDQIAQLEKIYAPYVSKHKKLSNEVTQYIRRVMAKSSAEIFLEGNLNDNFNSLWFIAMYQDVSRMKEAGLLFEQMMLNRELNSLKTQQSAETKRLFEYEQNARQANRDLEANLQSQMKAFRSSFDETHAKVEKVIEEKNRELAERRSERKEIEENERRWFGI